MDIFAVIPIVMAWAGLAEWRIRVMYNQLSEKIKDTQAINRVEQDNIKSNLSRLEAKLDLILKIQIEGLKRDAKRKTE